MKIPRDDMDMVPDKAYKELSELESNLAQYYSYLSRIQNHEPIMWDNITALTEKDLTNISRAYPGLLENKPTLLLTLTGFLIRSFVRGFKFGEAKWRIELEDEEVNKGDYHPKVQDFL